LALAAIVEGRSVTLQEQDGVFGSPGSAPATLFDTRSSTHTQFSLYPTSLSWFRLPLKASTLERDSDTSRTDGICRADRQQSVLLGSRVCFRYNLINIHLV